MKLEKVVSNMMRLSVTARLWHWMTDSAQHHTTFEQFLTQNETFTDSLVESALGNDFAMNLHEIGVEQAIQKSYSIDAARAEIKSYRSQIIETKKALEESEEAGADELVTIFDDVIELSSKTLYLLKLK